MVTVQQLELYINYRKTEWTEQEQDLLSMLLDFSAEKILNTKYPFGPPEGATVPKKHEKLQIRIAAELFARIGAFGEKEHQENGIYRYWENDDVAQRMLASEVMPCAGVF